MDYGGNDRRRTKKDLKRKRLVRVYRRGGRFRAQVILKGDSDNPTDNCKKRKKSCKK